MSPENIAAWCAIVVSLGLGVFNIYQGSQANRAASESVKVAKRATEIAEASDRRAARLEQVEFERSDVQWACNFADGQWIASNVGQDVAYDVQLTVDIDGERLTVTSKAVHPRDELFLDLSARAEQARATYASTVESLYRSGISYFGTPKLEFSQRITWRSEAGVWAVTASDEEVAV